MIEIVSVEHQVKNKPGVPQADDNKKVNTRCSYTGSGPDSLLSLNSSIDLNCTDLHETSMLLGYFICFWVHKCTIPTVSGASTWGIKSWCSKPASSF